MSTGRLKIGVDIDGVLIDTDSKAYLDFVERELGWSVNYEAFKKTHAWREAVGEKTQEEYGFAFHKFLVDTENSQRPIEGAHDALKELNKIADLYLITARVGTLRQITEEFLYEHLKDVAYHEISMGNLEQKAQRIIEFGVSYYIDDSYREISKILQNEDVDTQIVPFPGFHGVPRWEAFNDSRLHMLSIWGRVEEGLSDEQQAAIREKAWQEIVRLILDKKDER